MLVVKVYMWPLGRQDKERLWAQATVSCIGAASRDVPELGIREGERAYRARLLKAPRFNGPKDGTDVREVPKSKIWREGIVRGHRPSGPGRRSRGEWDLLGGVLKVLLGKRLGDYANGSTDAAEFVEEFPDELTQLRAKVARVEALADSLDAYTVDMLDDAMVWASAAHGAAAARIREALDPLTPAPESRNLSEPLERNSKG